METINLGVDELTDSGRRAKERVESLTDQLAAPAYDILDPAEVDQLIDDLELLAAAMAVTGSQ